MCGDIAIDVFDSEFVDSAFVDSEFVDSAFVDSEFVDSASVDSASVDSAFVDSASVDSASVDSAFVDSASVDSASVLDETTSSQPSKEQPTIYRVPERIRQHDKNKAYEPLLVSIGPYHHNKQDLVPMEEHKRRYLQAILSRNPAVSREDLLAEITKLEARARTSYSESITFGSNDFLNIMLLDGCFIVELFAKRLKKDGGDDPLYSNNRLLDTVITDMFLLENQLPYCILQCIYRIVFPFELVDFKLMKAAFALYDRISWLPLRGHSPVVRCYHHLLNLIHGHFLPSTPKTEIRLWHQTIPSAEKLKESGIKFKGIKFKRMSENWHIGVPGLYETALVLEEAPEESPESREADKDKGCVLDIEFNKHGVMEIPYLFIDDFTIRLLRNFVAFEQCSPSAGSLFTVYTYFMDAIINTKADVEILRDKRILGHACGSDKELALLFNGLLKGTLVPTRDFYLSSLFKDVNDYCDTKWHGWRASLMRGYFKNPWSIIAVIGAFLVIILTVIQSFFSVFAYVRPPH